MRLDDTSERIHEGIGGGFVVYGPSNDEWYSVMTSEATGDDLTLMLYVEPTSKPLTLTNENIAEWRREAHRAFRLDARNS